jgi:protein SCO1/2
MKGPSFEAGRVLVLAALIAGGAACERRDDGAATAASAARASATPSGEGSIYDLDVQLTNQDGRVLALADLRGRPLVAAMIYTSCTAVCPRVTQDMKMVERALANRPDIQFVLLSLDPGRDTPAALRAFAASHQLASSRWQLLAGSEEGVREIAAVLGVKYKIEASGEIAHSAIIVAVDPAGQIRHRQVGLNQDARELIASLAGTSP